MPEISHELSEVAWRAFRDSNKPAPYNQIRDALEAYEVAKNETTEAAITKALERLEAIASYQPRPSMKRELRELAEIFRLALAKPASSPAGGDVREALKALMKAVQRAEDGAGTLPAKEAVKLRPADWLAVCDRARRLAALSQSTSAGRVGE